MKNRRVNLALPSMSLVDSYQPGTRVEFVDGVFNVVSSVEDAKKFVNDQFELDVLTKYGVLSETPLVVAHHDSISVQLQFEDLIGKSSNEILPQSVDSVVEKDASSDVSF